MDRIQIGIVVCSVILVGTFGGGILVKEIQQSKGKQILAEKRKGAKIKLEQDIASGKRATAEPCAWLFYEIVTPAAELNDSPRLIIMGNEISSVTSPLDPSAYQLRIKGNRIELWTNFVAADRYSETSLTTWRKIGEKYSPDSPQCHSIATGHMRDSNR